MYGANVIIFEGILAFHNEDIRNLLDMKVGIFSVSTVLYIRNLLNMKIGIFLFFLYIRTSGGHLYFLK
jgi:hypothetical protein